MGILLKEKTPLEDACAKTLGEDSSQYYNVLSHLLLLNPDFIKRNDARLSAKVTSILFDEKIQDKVNTICEYIENADWDFNFNQSEIDYTKVLLEMDPELITTHKIISILKEAPDKNYSEIMRKVDIKSEVKMYRNREGYTRTKI